MLGVSNLSINTDAQAAERIDQPKRLTQRPDQVEAVNAVLGRLEGVGTRAQLRKACGTGKTLDGVKILEGLNEPRNLLLFPSLSLIAQTLEVHRAQAAHSRDYLVVCSDPSVVKGIPAETQLHQISQDAARYGEEDLGVRVTSDPDDVRRFLSCGSNQKVVLSTYQSGDVIAEAQKALRLSRRASSFGFAAFDEAHHCTGIDGGQFTRTLDEGFVSADRRLFMTATPRIYTEQAKSRGEADGKTLFSMDDVEHFGEVAYSLPFSRAIGMNLLTPYEVLVVAVNEKEIPGLKIEAGKPKLSGRELSESDLHLLASYVAIQKAMTEFDLKRVISFHNSVSRAKQFADHTRRDSFHAAASAISRRFGSNLWTQAIDGAMPASERKGLLERLKNLPVGMRGVFSNCRCLGEGVDVPTLDAVCFVDERRNVIDLVQAVGRAIRKSPNKEIGRVILAVFVPSGADPEKVVEGSSFRKVWQVLRALQAHDDTLAERLTGTRRASGSSVNGNELVGTVRPLGLSGAGLPIGLITKLDRALSVTAVTRLSPRQLTEPLIREWILQEFLTTQEWPSVKGGPVQVDGVADTWNAIRQAMERGGRGLPGGQSLSDLIEEVRKSIGDPTVLSEATIREWIIKEYEKTKRWPRPSDGQVQAEGINLPWKVVSAYLWVGKRGLPGGRRLGDLIEEVRAEYGQTTRRTIEDVKEAIYAHHLKYKTWPTRFTDTPVPGGRFTSWHAVNAALILGRHGLPKGGTLARVVAIVRQQQEQTTNFPAGTVDG